MKINDGDISHFERTVVSDADDINKSDSDDVSILHDGDSDEDESQFQQLLDAEMNTSTINDSYKENDDFILLENESPELAIGDQSTGEFHDELDNSNALSEVQKYSTYSLDIQQFHSSEYESGAAIIPLYEGSSVTLLEAVGEHFHWFTNHPGTSKQAVSEMLYMQHHTILTKGNVLPDSYQKAVRIVKPYLVEPIIYDVYPNDCVIFRGIISGLEKCPKCSTDIFKSTGSTRIPARTFYYLPLGPRLKRLFGTSNMAKLVQEHGNMLSSSILHDVHNSPAWKLAYERAQEFLVVIQEEFLSVSALMV